MTFLFSEISLESHILSEVEKNKPQLSGQLWLFRGPMIMIIILVMGKQVGLSVRVKALGLGKLLGDAGNSLSSSQHFPSTKGW